MSMRDKARRKSVHRRTDSGELDVFEASQYFSTDNVTTITMPQRIGVMRSTNPGRSNLDIPPRTLVLNLQNNNNKDNKKEQKKKPNSPGGKLASFFNSLISQTASKKKNKPSKSPTPNQRHEDEAPGPGDWRTRRRSSMTAVSATIKCDISTSGFRTPPPPYTPMKPYNKKPTNSTLEQDFRFVTHNRFVEEEDGDDNSDSSSDLFELQLNYNHKHVEHHKLGYCANDLPVYETTCMDKIKLASTTPITSGPFRN